MHIARNLALRWSISKGARTSPFVVLPGMLLFVVLPGRGRPFLTKLPGPWVYITSTPVPVPVFRCHNKLLQVKWARNADWWPRVPMFSKRAGILVSKLGAEARLWPRGSKASSLQSRPRARKQDPRSPAACEKIMGHAPLLKLSGSWTSSFVRLSEPWVYITSTPAPVPVSWRHNKLL